MLAAAFAAWLSQATLAFAGTGAARVAIFPLSITSLLIVVAAAALVWLAWRAGASLAPLWLLALVALPWLSASAPPALLIWSGPMVLAVWAAIAVSMLVTLPVGRAFRFRQGSRGPAGPAVAGAIALIVYSVAAWQVAPSIPGGDEPHYLIITQSLLEDHDLKIENNHRQGDYHAYFAGELPKPDYRRRGRNGEIYSIHAPGLPALIAPAFAVGGYHGVVVFLILVASAGSALAWSLALDRHRAPRCGMVRLGGRHAVDEPDLSQLHGVSRRCRRRPRGDRCVGAAAGAAGGRERNPSGSRRGGCTAPRSRCCPGFTPVSRCSPAASAP